MTEFVQNETHKRFSEIVTQINNESQRAHDENYARSHEALTELFNSLIQSPEEFLRDVVRNGSYSTTIRPARNDTQPSPSGEHYPFADVRLEEVESYQELKAAMDAIDHPLSKIDFKDEHDEVCGDTQYRETKVSMTFKI